MLEILVQLNGENRSLDLNPDTTFSVNYSIANVKDIAESNGSYTKTITLPDTHINRAILGYVTDLSVDLEYNYNTYGSFNPNKQVRCIVMENSIVVLEGYLQVTKFTSDENTQNKQIECVIYADNSSFYIKLGDQYLTDIDFSEYNFTYSIAEIKSTWNNHIDAYKDGKYFPLVDYGHGWTLDDLNNSSLYRLGVKDFKPAVFVKTIWDKIFATHSFHYSSKFLGSTNKGSVVYPDQRFANLVIPYNNSAFQTGPQFNQDKIFHVGLTTSTLGQYSLFTMSVDQCWNSTFSGIASKIVNMDYHSTLGATLVNVKRWQWFDGYLLSPFQHVFDRNTHFNDTDLFWSFDQVVIPFGLTASPMFNTYNSIGQPTYNTGPAIPDFNYQNQTVQTFKQRFILNTDIVTLYSNQYNIDNFIPGIGAFGFPVAESYNYIIKVGFYREFDPTVGPSTCPDWLSGTGYPIPADLGGLSGTLNMCYDESLVQDKVHHWVCDIFGRSNCFDKNNTLIVPTGDSRYLGKYCTNYLGNKCTEPGDTSPGGGYNNNSGDCISWYYNDAANQTDPHNRGLWCSGLTDGDTEMRSSVEPTYQPAYGDWYQQLQLQTIYLDNDSTDPLYGAAGSVVVKGNTPIYPGEKVRCIIFFGGKFRGQQVTSTYTSYKPPSAGYVLSSTNFANDPPYPYGKYQYPATQVDSSGNLTNNPLTVFYNDVSNDYIEGMAVDFNDAIPKNIKQRDFILDIVRLHNLYIEPLKTDPNTLLIEPSDDYYALGTHSLDWSAKVDLTTPVEVQILAETQNRSTLFTYKEDKDWWNKQYTQYTNQRYGEQTFSIDNDFLTDTKKIESIFSPTPLVQLFSTFGSGIDTLATNGGFIIPVIVSGTNQKPDSTESASGTSQYNYRILYKGYIENRNTDEIYLFDGFTHSYPYAGPYDDPYNPTYTLNWGQTLGEFFNEATDNFPATLVNSYWATLLTELTDMNSKIVTVSMYLTPYDINNFYFYKVVYLELDGVSGYYKVNSIEDYVPGQNSVCKVTLIKSNVS